MNFEINFSKAILTEAGLGFLGIGIDPSIPTLGNMLNSSQTYFLTAPWFPLFPGLTIIYIVYLVNNFSLKKGKNMEELEIENLNVTIDSEHLLKNICIKINKNEVVGILGESGSGKTLTTKFMLNILPEKAIVSYDKYIKNTSIGAIFQNAFIVFNPTIKLGRQLKHLYKSHYNTLKGFDEKIEEIFKQVGLDKKDFLKNILLNVVVEKGKD